MDKACVYLAQKLLIKCNIRNVHIKSVNDIDVRFFYLLFSKICTPFIEDPPLLPSLNYETDLMRTILDCISCDFLNYDLSTRVTPEAIQAKNVDSVHFVLNVFDNLYDCLHADSAEKTTVKRPTSVPSHLHAKLNACGKKSTLYSPRTAYFRRKGVSKESLHLTVKQQKNDILKTEDIKILRRMGLSNDDLKLLKFENLIHRAKFAAILNNLKVEHAKNERDLKNRAAKLALNRAIRQNVFRVIDRKSEALTMKRAKLTFENSLKHRKRAKVISSTEMTDGIDGNSSSGVSPEEYTDVLRRMASIDREAEKFLTEFIDRQHTDERNVFDSVDNFRKGKVDQLQNN